MRKILCLILGWLAIPHLVCYLCSKNKSVLDKDIYRWIACLNVKNSVMGGGKYKLLNLVYLLLFVKEFRNVFYLRIGKIKFLLYYLPPLSSLYICTKSEKFGAGTYIQHGFATVITAESIGENCWINQQVTIGFNDSRKYGYGKPIIGDNVRVSAGAKVCGKVTVGEGSTIGVNAVVVKDVPPHSVVVPSPMMLIMENGEKVYKKL